MEDRRHKHTLREEMNKAIHARNEWTALCIKKDREIGTLRDEIVTLRLENNRLHFQLEDEANG